MPSSNAQKREMAWEAFQGAQLREEMPTQACRVFFSKVGTTKSEGKLVGFVRSGAEKTRLYRPLETTAGRVS